MSRPVVILSAVIACELLVAACLVGWWAHSDSTTTVPAPPRPDLTFLDSVTAEEIRGRQDAVAADQAEDWRALAEIYVLYGFFAEADICCRRAAELDPESFWTHLWWGTTLSRIGDTKASTEKFRAGIPHAEDALADVCRYCIGLNLLREEDALEAEAAFRTAMGYAPADYELAKLLVRSDRSEEAVPILDGLIANHPQTQKYYQLRSRAARRLGDLDAGDKYQDQADRATEVLPSDELTGFLEQQIGNHGLDVWVQEGKALYVSGLLDTAATRLREVLEIEWRPEPADLLALAELKLGHPEVALPIQQESIRRSGTTPQRLVTLGDIYHATANEAQAKEAWQRATELRLHPAAHERLAAYFEQVGDKREAGRHQGLALMAAGIGSARAGELDAGLNMLQQAVVVAPDLAHAWFHLGECHRLLGQPDSAHLAYNQCLTLDPYHGRARRGLDRMRRSQ